MLGLRSKTSPQERRRLARQVEDRVLDLPEVVGARTVLVFASFGSEVPTDGLIRRLSSRDRSVLLPFIKDGDLHAARYRPGDALRRTTYGPNEPADRTIVDPAAVDVAVVPGLAF